MFTIIGIPGDFYETNSRGLITRGRIPAVLPATGLPDVTTLVYAVGCELVEVSTGATYVNIGTEAAPVWSQGIGAKVAQYVEVDITSANITGTSAGQLGHAQGVLLIPAAPAGFVNILDQAVMSYLFNTAAYTGGGNTTVNIGGGGAALSGLVSAANGLGKASSNITQFVPLATVGIGQTSAQSINLVAASAFTQPGTAAGTIKVHLWYKQVPI